MKKKAKRKGVTCLPRYISGKLRITCATRGFSDPKSGKGRQLNKQDMFMSKFYHGSPLNYPCEIMLLSKQRSSFRDLFEEDTLESTKKTADIDKVRVL